MKHIFPRMLTMADIARHRLAWAKHLQKENEELEAEVKRLREVLDEHEIYKCASCGEWEQVDDEVTFNSCAICSEPIHGHDKATDCQMWLDCDDEDTACCITCYTQNEEESE